MKSLSAIVKNEEVKKGFEIHDKYKRMKEKLAKNREEVDQVMDRAFKPKKIGYNVRNGRLVDRSQVTSFDSVV